jgi:hypothetical protein
VELETIEVALLAGYAAPIVLVTIASRTGDAVVVTDSDGKGVDQIPVIFPR